MKEPVNSSHRWRKLFWARGWVWNFFWQVRIGLFDRRLRNIRAADRGMGPGLGLGAGSVGMVVMANSFLET